MQYRLPVIDFSIFALYWIGLGVLSSVGFGSGLHTFILYLGPHIAKVVLVANECNALPEYVPNRWRFDHFATCKRVRGQEPLTFLVLYKAVFLEAFLWGAGTAIGELPPYFVARAASKAGQKTEEVESVLDEMDGIETSVRKKSYYERTVNLMMKWLERNAFITVLFAASVSRKTYLNVSFIQIPNPLFDLAGLMCGHFGVDFATFFSAVLIGKAFNKVSIQICMIIVGFSKHLMEKVLEFTRRYAPNVSR